MTFTFDPEFGYFIHNGQMIKKKYIEVAGRKTEVEIPYCKKVLYTDTDGTNFERSRYPLVSGQVYETISLHVESMYSTVKLKGIKGSFNTVCFHVLDDDDWIDDLVNNLGN
jgi:hypothetical protein